MKRSQTVGEPRRDQQDDLKLFTYANNGVLNPYKDFKVDNFYANRREQYTFFLSHCHEGMLNYNSILQTVIHSKVSFAF